MDRAEPTSATGVVTAGSNSKAFGGKEVISLTPALYDYLLSNVREPEILRKLRIETASKESRMQVSPEQAQLLAMLVQIIGANRCIEVGVFKGYSSLAIALALPDTGYLVACEQNPIYLEVAKSYFKEAGVSHKIDARRGDAEKILNSLLDHGDAGSNDFAFIDADKRKNQEYFELLMQLVRVGGVIVVDNVLWHGKVADSRVNDAKTLSIREFNNKLMEDERVSISMVPIGDGITICRKRRESLKGNSTKSSA